jgi:hypothetical protein
MKRFIEGQDRSQSTLFPESLEDYIAEDNPVRVIEVFVEGLDLAKQDARSMATSGRGTGMVGYNVQTAVDAKHHLIVAHEVTNVGHDRNQLFSMAKHTRGALETDGKLNGHCRSWLL